MAKSQQTSGKKDLEKKRLRKRQEKQEKMEQRKANPKGGFDSMIAYVDEYGNITNTPPDPTKKKVIDAGSIEIGVPKKEKQAADAVRTGKVKFFNTEKGFGFIEQQNSKEEFFVHVNGLLDSIKENDTVTFGLERGNKGMQAVRVKKD